MAAHTQRVLDYIQSMVEIFTGEFVDLEETAYENGFVKRDPSTGEYTIPQHHLQELADMYDVDVNVLAIA